MKKKRLGLQLVETLLSEGISALKHGMHHCNAWINTLHRDQN